MIQIKNLSMKLIPLDQFERAKAFLLYYTKTNYNNIKKINMIVDIVRTSMRRIFDEFLLHFISLTQDVELFGNLQWRGSGGIYSGDIIISDIEVSEWKSILSTIEISPIGFKLIPIKKYINDQIERSLRYGDWERQRRFTERY